MTYLARVQLTFIALLVAVEAQAGSKDDMQPYYIASTLILFSIQAFLIFVLQRSRIRYKRAKQELKQAKKSLEDRVTERTESLKRLNKALYEEIGRHEVTEILLRETQDYLNSIINSMPSILIGLTKEGQVTHWNSAAVDSTHISYEDALGKNLSEMMPNLPITQSTIVSIIDTKLPKKISNHQELIDNHPHYSDLTIYPLMATDISGVVIIIDDVTLKIRVENMLIQSEKMHSLGELAAGMAHELNNPLSAILHGLQNIQRRISIELPVNHEIAKKNNLSMTELRQYLADREIYTFLDGIREAGERAANLVRNMLEFSRTSIDDYQSNDVIEMVTLSIELASRAYELVAPAEGNPLTIKKEFDNDLPPINCVSSEIQQVLINLLRNACQSFISPDRGGPVNPTITIRAYQLHDDICIDIEDNGMGMDDHVRKHIFEPFYTTKEVGTGTGLGLAVTYFILTEHHDGSIEVKSSPSNGSTFTIKLPIE